MVSAILIDLEGLWTLIIIFLHTQADAVNRAVHAVRNISSRNGVKMLNTSHWRVETVQRRATDPGGAMVSYVAAVQITLNGRSSRITVTSYSAWVQGTTEGDRGVSKAPQRRSYPLPNELRLETDDPVALSRSIGQPIGTSCTSTVHAAADVRV